jgi:hypothetical protein
MGLGRKVKFLNCHLFSCANPVQIAQGLRVNSLLDLSGLTTGTSLLDQSANPGPGDGSPGRDPKGAQPLEPKKLDMLYTMERIRKKIKMKDKIIMQKNIKIKKILKRIALGGILWSVASAIYAANASI